MPTSAPTQTPIASRNHSRRHSFQLVITRLVERRAAITPSAAHTTALVAMATSQRKAPPITGIPVSGSVGNAMIARTKPGMPRHADPEPMRSKADTIPSPAGSSNDPRTALRRTIRRWNLGPSGTDARRESRTRSATFETESTLSDTDHNRMA